MFVVLLILAVLGVVVVTGVVLENTAPMTVTLFGQELTGLSAGEWLAAAAGLGFLVMLLLWLAGVFAGRRRARGQDLRVGRDDLADRVADLERENYMLRQHPAPEAPTAERRPAAEQEPVADQEPATDQDSDDGREPVAPGRSDSERP